jgi:hypothetical protein
MRFAPWPRPYIGAARRLRELPYKPAAAQVDFRLAAFAAPFAARAHAAVDSHPRGLDYLLSSWCLARWPAKFPANREFFKKRTGNSDPTQFPFCSLS